MLTTARQNTQMMKKTLSGKKNAAVRQARNTIMLAITARMESPYSSSSRLMEYRSDSRTTLAMSG